MINYIKIYWKLILVIIFTLIIIISMLVGAIKFKNLSRKLEKAEIELIKQEGKKEQLIENKLREDFSNKIKISEKKIKNKEIKSNEIKESIKNPTIDFTDDSIQNWVNTKFNDRGFFKD